MTDKKTNMSPWVVGGMTLLGLGVGFIFLQTSALIFLASIFIGLGLGLVLGAVLSGKR